MKFTSNTTNWRPMFPGTTISRMEIAQQMVDLYHDPNDEAMFRLMRYNVLTVGQIAALRQLSRQRVYIKMLQQGVSPPERVHIVSGTLNAEHVNAILRAIVIISTAPNKFRAEHLEGLRRAGSPGLIQHLTGVDIRKGEITYE